MSTASVRGGLAPGGGSPRNSITTDPTINELIGLFDAPAFARRGQELEEALSRLEVSCLRERRERLGLVRRELRGWEEVTDQPNGWVDIFEGPIDDLWPASEAHEPRWARRPARRSRRLAAAAAILAGIERFNQIWLLYLDSIPLDRINHTIQQYNRWYMLEKECALGSARLAAQMFTPRPLIRLERLREQYPGLRIPRLSSSGGMAGALNR